MNRYLGFLAVVAFSSAALGCDGDSDGSGNGTPAPTPTNRNPSIASINVSPSFGVVGLSQSALAATATDPDNDALTFQWTVGGQTLNGANQTIPMPGDGPQTARLTVTDGKGGTATDSREFASGVMTGTWRYTLDFCGNTAFLMFAVVQAGTAWSATMTQAVSNALCDVQAAATGGTDPSVPATINAAGAITARVKLSGEPDVLLTGTMDTSGPTAGRRITGTGREVGTGNVGQFQLTKQ